jgi:hypothetical protein
MMVSCSSPTLSKLMNSICKASKLRWYPELTSSMKWVEAEPDADGFGGGGGPEWVEVSCRFLESVEADGRTTSKLGSMLLDRFLV